jgi:hypothetical protein
MLGLAPFVGETLDYDLDIRRQSSPGFFVEKEYLDMVFEISQEVTHTGYYVYMGNAWLISCCMATFPEETIGFFKNNTLDMRTHNKAIQKSRESYRVSKEHKVLLLGLKKGRRR